MYVYRDRNVTLVPNVLVGNAYRYIECSDIIIGLNISMHSQTGETVQKPTEVETLSKCIPLGAVPHKVYLLEKVCVYL